MTERTYKKDLEVITVVRTQDAGVLANVACKAWNRGGVHLLELVRSIQSLWLICSGAMIAHV